MIKYFIAILVILSLVYVTFLYYDKSESKEGFFGGYYYPYDYPYYWPYFYSGCNENVFGDVKCLPFYAHPFW